MFQSSPTSKGGRYTAFNVGVSILAHLERWALRQFWVYLRSKLFQSSPTSKGGRYGGLKLEGTVLNRMVSILAHLERWALHYGADPYHKR